MTDLEDQPPSAKLVVKVLEYRDEALIADEIAAESRLSRRTVDYALSRLHEADHVNRRPDHRDARRYRYWLD